MSQILDLQGLGVSPLKHTRHGRELIRCRTQIERGESHLELPNSDANKTDIYNSLELWKAYQELILSPAALDISKIISTTSRYMDVMEFPKPKPRSYNSPHEAIVNEIYESCSNSALLARRDNYVYRLCVEFAHARRNGWYAIFNTLTCRNDALPKVFGDGHSEYWKDYIRNVEYYLARSDGICYKDIYNDKKSYHRYFAVVELGHDSGRLHIHVIHLAKHLPVSGRWQVNDARMCEEYTLPGVSACWNFGISHATALRISDKDAYSKYIRWPRRVSDVTGRVDNTPDLEYPDTVLAQYVTKYLTKSRTTDPGVNKWRTKATKNLGTGLLKTIAEDLTDKQLYALMVHRTPLPIETDQVVLSIPSALLIYIAEKEWMKRQLARKPKLLLYQRQTSISERVKSLAANALRHNLTSSDRLNPLDLLDMAEYDSLLKTIGDAHREYFTKSPLDKALTRGVDR